MLSVLKDTVDVAVLEQLIVKLAARIKSPKAWPEKPVRCVMAGFRVYADLTPEKGLRRVVVTHPKASALRVTLVDANPNKVVLARRKVMVYLKEGVNPERVGQVRFASLDGALVSRPRLVWFEEKTVRLEGVVLR